MSKVVMTEERTLVSEEVIDTGEGKRILTTYKSPLYDLDNSVMGTVGVLYLRCQRQKR